MPILFVVLKQKTKLIDLLAAMTCVENGEMMTSVDREEIRRG